MIKKIFVLNGKPQSGKDTFAAFLNEFIPTDHYSAVTKVKAVAEMCGWNGKKDLKSRKFISDLKFLTSEFNDMSFQDIRKKVNEFMEDDDTYEVLLIDCREAMDIERCHDEFGAESIYIFRPDVFEQEVSNDADEYCENYAHTYFLTNDGSLEDFRKVVKYFYENYILPDR